MDSATSLGKPIAGRTQPSTPTTDISREVFCVLLSASIRGIGFIPMRRRWGIMTVLERSLSENLELRIRRARSWLQRARTEPDDPDASFIFYWIAFNAAYARYRRNAVDTKERNLFDDYFRTVLSIDPDNSIHKVIMDTFSGSVRLLLINQYVYRPFWQHVFGMGYDNWEDTFEAERSAGLRAVLHGNTREVLNIIFDRLYVARNQVMHGGATWKLGRNREQIRDGVRILSALVPLFVDLMESNPQIDWGPPDYHLVGPTGSIL